MAEAVSLPPIQQLGASSLVEMAVSKGVMAYARKQCLHRFGYRFVRVKIQGNHFICQFRDSNATIAKKASRRCAGEGASLQGVTKVYIKGNRYIAHMICKRG